MSDVTRPIPPAPGDAPDGPEQTAADLTTPIVVERPRLARQQVVLVLIATAAATFLVGLVVGTTSGPRDDVPVLTSAEVTPEGRTIRFDGGLMVFPRGAVDRPTRVVVRAEPLRSRLRVEDDGTSIVVDPGELRAYRFEPAGLAFDEPVEITFRLPRDARRAAIFARQADDTRVLAGTIDYVRGTATLRVRDLRFDDR